MGDYLSIANKGVFFVCGGIILFFIFLQAVIYIMMAFKEGKKCGISRDKMLKAFRAGAITSIVPAISVVLALIAMAPVLGIPIPWIRLSVIGSAPYELMAAGIGAKSMGINGLGGAGYTKEAFALSVWTMCIGSVWAVSIVLIFLKTIKGKFSKALDKDPGWRTVLMNAAFLGVFCIFMADPITKGGLPLTTLLSGGVIMTVLALLIVKLKVEWLKEFALTFSMVGAMACAILFSNIIH